MAADFGRFESGISDAAGAPERSSAVGGEREEDLRLVAAIRSGDHRAFLSVVERHHRAMVRLASATFRPGSILEAFPVPHFSPACAGE